MIEVKQNCTIIGHLYHSARIGAMAIGRGKLHHITRHVMFLRCAQLGQQFARYPLLHVGVPIAKGHPEVEGTMGQLPDGIHLVEDSDDVLKVQPKQTELLAVVTQTTLSVDDAAEILLAVKKRFPSVREPKQQDICYATQNRQDAVKLMSPQVDVLVVVGSPTSSNSNRLRELGSRLGADSYMIDSADELKNEWFEGKHRVGLTAGASAPEVLVQDVITRLRALGATSIRKLDGVTETIKFPLPKGLKLNDGH